MFRPLAFLQHIVRTLKTAFRGERFLCDDCRYDYNAACSRPERPNALRCPDYKPK
jgi:transposase-like protein